MTPLARIKLVHTIVWIFFVSLISHVMYAGLTDTVSMYTWIAVGLVFMEGLVLVLNDGKCPMTNLAEKHSDPHAHNFDIYLPEWLAKHNKVIFTTIFFLGLGLVVWRTLD